MPRLLRALVVGPPVAWGFLAIALTPWAGTWPRGFAAAVYAAVLGTIAVLSGRRGALGVRPLLAVAVLALATGTVVRGVPRASNERTWVLEQSRPATAEIAGDRLTVRNLRAFRYAADGTPAPAWEDRTYDLAALDSAWLAVSPFSSIPGVGHVFVSFGFRDGEFLAISVEARKEAGERYSPLRGLFRSYEVAYVVGRESDLCFLRSDLWRDPLYLYPVRTPPERARAALVSMLRRANDLAARPEFYDTIGSSCSSNLARHVNEVAPGRIPGSLRVLLAGFSDALAFDLGLLDVDDLDTARARYLVAPGSADPADPGYSRRIRSRR